MGCNCGKRRMQQVTSANIPTDSTVSPTHAEAQAKLAAQQADMRREEVRSGR